jgi:hypothetical protein
MEKEKVVEGNPFRREKKNKAVDDIFKACLKNACSNKRDGLMFKLFDIGNMSFNDAKLLTYRNIVGAGVRKLMNSCNSREDLNKHVDYLKEDIMRIVRLGSDNEEFIKMFRESVDDVCGKFIRVVDQSMMAKIYLEKSEGVSNKEVNENV